MRETEGSRDDVSYLLILPATLGDLINWKHYMGRDFVSETVGGVAAVGQCPH